MLTLRQRGKKGTWHIRGTVSFGGRTIDVPEFSTGSSDETAARFLMSQRERELVEEIMFGPRAIAARATIADALEVYLSKPKTPSSSDILRVGKLNDIVGDMGLNDPKAAWRKFQDAYLQGYEPAGQDRYRSVLQAAVNLYLERMDLAAIKIKAIPFDNQRIRFLSRADRDLLISKYAKHVQPIATMLAFQGPRTQEALQVPWGARGVDMERGTIFFEKTKTNNPRTVHIHERVDAVLRPMWEERGKPDGGHVFLNRYGEPYTDTRDLEIQGGNPIKTAHNNACKRAGIAEFSPHDWRHHWASHCVMAGIDLITIMIMGGWKSLRMVQRYAAVDTPHMREAVLKIT